MSNILDNEIKNKTPNPKKKNSNFGLKMGFLFCGISILSGVTMVVPILYGGLLESIATEISKVINKNVGITSFYISIIMLAIPSIIYINSLIKKSADTDTKLVLLFLICLVFLNTAWFYKDWLNTNFRMDGQQALGLLFMPVITSWVYLVLGFIHDWIKLNEVKYKS